VEYTLNEYLKESRVDRLELIESLKRMRMERCAYINSENFCDCKYGYDPKLGRVGEKTGCAELRLAIRYLDEMEGY
jgi:hypothetical protein